MKKTSTEIFPRKTAGLLGAFLLLSSFLFTGLFVGCASTGKEYRPPYKEVLKDWTRSVKVYDGVDLRLSISATYKNRDFRYAYVEHYVDVYRIEEGVKEAMRARELKESELYNEFFLSVATPDKSLNDLDSKTSVWRLYLEDGTGTSLSPVSVERIDISSALTSALFPYVDSWSVGYIVRFPKYSASGTEPVPNLKSRYLRLLIVGLLGNGELTWQVNGKLNSDKAQKRK